MAVHVILTVSIVSCCREIGSGSRTRGRTSCTAAQREPTMANMDVKTAFGMAGPKYIAKIMGDQEVHGWIAAALFRVAGLEGQATLENVESTLPFTRCIRQGSVDAPWIWLKMAMQQ